MLYVLIHLCDDFSYSVISIGVHTSMNVKSQIRKKMQQAYFSRTKHPWKYPALVLLITLLDTLLLVVFFMTLVESIPLLGIIFLHIVLGILLYVIRAFSSPQTKNISPILFLILPGIGALIYGISYLSLYISGSRESQKEITHAYKDEVSIQYTQNITINFEHIARLMDMSGVFSFSSSMNKKQMIIDLLSVEANRNYTILKHGLSDRESEVVHYTASALNYLEEKFERAIKRARDSLAENLTFENFETVRLLYHNYIASGLLEDDFIPIYRRKMIEVLEMQMIQFGSDIGTAKQLIDAYIAQGELETAWDLLQKTQQEHPEDMDLQIISMKYFYHTREFSEVAQRAREVLEHTGMLTEEQKRIATFWADGSRT